MTVYIKYSKPSTNSQNQWLNLARVFDTWLIYKNQITYSRSWLKVFLPLATYFLHPGDNRADGRENGSTHVHLPWRRVKGAPKRGSGSFV